MKWYVQTAADVVANLDSNIDSGLTLSKVQTSRLKYGENKLLEKVGETVLHMIVGELTGFLNVLLILAAIISIVASKHLSDGLFIFAIVISTNFIIKPIDKNLFAKRITNVRDGFKEGQLVIFRTFKKQNSLFLDFYSE